MNLYQSSDNKRQKFIQHPTCSLQTDGKVGRDRKRRKMVYIGFSKIHLKGLCADLLQKIVTKVAVVVIVIL